MTHANDSSQAGERRADAPVCDECRQPIPYGRHVTTRQSGQLDQACYAKQADGSVEAGHEHV